GAKGHLDRICKRIHAAQHLFARIGREFYFLGSHFLRVAPYTKSALRSLAGRFGVFDDSKTVAFLHDQQVLPVDPDLAAASLAEQHAISRLDVAGGDLALLGAGAGSYRAPFARGGLFLGGIRNDDAAVGFLVGLAAADDNAVMQG